MPFALILIGAVLLISGFKNTQVALGKQLAADFTGSGNFIYWVISLVVVGAIGYIPGLEKFSRTFLLLILVSFLLKNGGFFSEFNQAIQQGSTTAPAQGQSAVPAAYVKAASQSSGGGGGLLGAVSGGIDLASGFGLL